MSAVPVLDPSCNHATDSVVVVFLGGGGLNILAISAHAKQIKTQKYENSCLVAYENTARNQGHQTKRLQEVTEK